MIHLFNRRELSTTMDLHQLSAIQNALADAGIPCAVRSKGQASSAVTLGMGALVRVTYHVYVHKKDYDRACFALRQARR